MDQEDAGYIPVPLDYARLSSSESLARSRDFLETMRRRRSVRMVSPDPVPYELIANAVATVPAHALIKKPLEEILVRY